MLRIFTSSSQNEFTQERAALRDYRLTAKGRTWLEGARP